MKETRSWLLLLAGLVLVVGLPLAGRWARRQAGPRCTLDGLAIEPVYRVRVVDRAGGEHVFCCVRCAGRWLARQAERPATVYVTEPLPAPGLPEATSIHRVLLAAIHGHPALVLTETDAIALPGPSDWLVLERI